MLEHAVNIKVHNHILELIQAQISYDIAKADSSEGTRPKSSSISGTYIDVNSYFCFIDFLALQVIK